MRILIDDLLLFSALKICRFLSQINVRSIIKFLFLIMELDLNRSIRKRSLSFLTGCIKNPIMLVQASVFLFAKK